MTHHSLTRTPSGGVQCASAIIRRQHLDASDRAISGVSKVSACVAVDIEVDLHKEYVFKTRDRGNPFVVSSRLLSPFSMCFTIHFVS
jgi:hypothetical protein